MSDFTNWAVNPAGAAGAPVPDAQGKGPAAKKAAPPPPDYKGAAGDQSNQSHVNQSGPVGSSSWSQGPDGRWTQSQQFNDTLGGAAQNYQRQIAGQGALDFSGLTPINNGDQARQQAQDASYGQATSRLDPRFAQQGEAMKAQLAAQGLDPGTEAANNAQGNFDRAKTDAYGSAQRYSVEQGQQAQQQAFSQSMGARQQQIGEMLRQRGMPMEQLQQLMSLMGQGQATGAAQGPNYLGAAGMQGDYQLGGHDSEMNAWGSGGQAAGSALGAILSDERAKQNVERLPIEVIDGVPFAIYEYRHAPGRKILGVIAQDVLRVAPNCVVRRADGLYAVDYAALGRLQ